MVPTSPSGWGRQQPRAGQPPGGVQTALPCRARTLVRPAHNLERWGISPLDLAGIGLMSAEEAGELHAMEMTAVQTAG